MQEERGFIKEVHMKALWIVFSSGVPPKLAVPWVTLDNRLENAEWINQSKDNKWHKKVLKTTKYYVIKDFIKLTHK